MTEAVAVDFRVPLVGCDGFVLALEDLMASGLQGRHVGVSVLTLGEGFSADALRSAAARFSKSHPLLHAKLEREWCFSLPEWRATGPFGNVIPVIEHPVGTSLETVCATLLQAPVREALRFELIPGPEATLVAFRWLHLLLDGRGVELALQEIARLAAHPNEPATIQSSWGAAFEVPSSLRERLRNVRPFVKRHNALKEIAFDALGKPSPEPGASRFSILHFDVAQTATIRTRAHHLTGGIFQLPYFFAVVARAHAAVFAARGNRAMNFHAGAPVQRRRRGAVHPIFQNQTSQMYFGLTHEEVGSLESATRSIHSQFSSMVKEKADSAFLIMVQFLLRVPSSLYMDGLRRENGAGLTSFFHSHTGCFMPETRVFCGAQILNGWHIPSVSNPPGTGIFFSECNRSLTATISWREGVLSPSELICMTSQLREDLLGLPSQE